MQHNYSDLLIAYLYNEIEPQVKKDLESQLKSDTHLQQELIELKESLAILQNVQACTPSQASVNAILEECVVKEETLSC